MNSAFIFIFTCPAYKIAATSTDKRIYWHSMIFQAIINIIHYDCLLKDVNIFVSPISYIIIFPDHSVSKGKG